VELLISAAIMFPIICASAVSISLDGSVRVFVRTAQHMPFAVRAIMVVDPGRLPLRHQSPAPLPPTTKCEKW
jgi:hypothetical protein